MRAAGLGKIAGRAAHRARASGDQAAAAVDQIAAQMQQFLASDVIYDTRVIPFIQEALEEQRDRRPGHRRLAVPAEPRLAAARRRSPRSSARRGRRRQRRRDDENVAPGLHGHGLVSTAVGDTTLQPGETANRIPAGSDIAFTVTFANQGENDEERRQRPRPDPRRRHEDDHRAAARPDTTAGRERRGDDPAGAAPPIGTPVTIEVTVARVPGEEKVDNNRQSYTAIFTR